MPAPPPAFYVENLLEDAIITMTPDGADPLKPSERLLDRDIGLECEDLGAVGTHTWHFDRGLDAATPTVHAWIFAGSGFAGETVVLQSSPDDSTWTARGTATPVADAPVRVALTPFAAPRYLRVQVADPTVPVKFSEIFVSPMVALTWKPSVPSIREPTRPNVLFAESASGRAYGVKRGERRWSSTYVMTASPDADRVEVMSLLDSIADGAKPFWLLTFQGELKWVRTTGQIDFQATDRMATAWDVSIPMVEELP